MNRKLKKLTKQKEARENQIKVYVMQSVVLTNYLKLCSKLGEVPRMELIEILSNSENLKELLEHNKNLISHLN